MKYQANIVFDHSWCLIRNDVDRNASHAIIRIEPRQIHGILCCTWNRLSKASNANSRHTVRGNKAIFNGIIRHCAIYHAPCYDIRSQSTTCCICFSRIDDVNAIVSCDDMMYLDGNPVVALLLIE